MQQTLRTTTAPWHVRRGFTMLEMLVAMTVTLIIVALAAPLYQMQTKAVNNTAGRADATRSAVFAADAAEQDLRNTGVGVFDGQPFIVRAASDAISFNANMVTARRNDIVAVFFDPDADSTALSALTPATSVTLPNSSNTYPSVNYTSNAETISYYTVADTAASPLPGHQMYMLLRRVNRQSPEVVARNLLRSMSGGTPLFTYFRRNASGSLTQLNDAALPIFHSVPRHGSAADTGATAAVDSIAVVRLTAIAVYKDPRGGYTVDTLRRDVRLANQGLLQRAQCGEIPLVPGSPGLTQITLSGLPAVRLVWNASTDETAGERDVEMYAVYRRVAGTTDWGEPLANVPGAGTATLTFVDNTVLPTIQYDYAVSAIDCTPAPSSITPPVTILVTP
jgi:prepilin-type N-terminal cleavage/methylation domain-containing protein